jgi:hypothetical protein
LLKAARRLFLAAAVVLVPLVGGLLALVPSASAATLPPIKHVWIIMLENESYNYSFGSAGDKYAPYLTKTLPSEGALLKDYYGTAHDSLPNYVAMVSGQASNYMMAEDCTTFQPFLAFGGENFDTTTKYGQLSGEGCVFPKSVQTVGNELSSAGLTWKEYAQDMGNDPKRDKSVMTANGPACGHPALGQTDLTDTTGPANDSYATRHNGFMYFESVIGNQSFCDAHDSRSRRTWRASRRRPTTRSSRLTRVMTATTGRSARTAAPVASRRSRTSSRSGSPRSWPLRPTSRTG